MRLLLLLREPIFDRIPSLKSLVWGLAEKGHELNLITASSPRFPIPSLVHPRFHVTLFREREKKYQLPTTVMLAILAGKALVTNHYDAIIGSDAYSNVLASKLADLFRIPYICFQLEYPEVPPKTLLDRKETAAIQKAQILITHDRWHHDFLRSNLNIEKAQVCYLPNATFSPSVIRESHMLQDRLKEYGRKLILHSGGFGRWFRCKQLVEASDSWPNDYMLVFHLSHRIDGDPYFEAIHSGNHPNTAYSLEAVNTYELDSLVSSAHIGVALYSEKDLGYRAKYMGLAAGKIGNYLKCGIPVIATKLPSLQYLEDYRCGLLVNDESEILPAIRSIDTNYLTYRRNAVKCYEELWHPEPYVSKIEHCINSLI